MRDVEVDCNLKKIEGDGIYNVKWMGLSDWDCTQEMTRKSLEWGVI